ncbi:MAG: arginine--tRNA ligase [Gammaproteobacteria bacterium]|nr:arginine--tRNA ligase [Gammaproteobacteria bacterium]
MKQHIENLIHTALKQLQSLGELQELPSFQVDATKDKLHGDFASNVALVLAKVLQRKPREVAAQLITLLPASASVQKVEIAGPGFINFFLSPQALTEVIRTILTEKEHYGRSTIGRSKRILVEFLSSNPTGPLHVGHGRHAAFGSVVCNLLEAVGFKVFREYYLNDAGRQVDILTVSVWLRYLTLCGEVIVFPSNAYRGDYVKDIAQAVHAAQAAHFQVSAQEIFLNLPPDEPEGGDKEIYIDAIIERAKHLLKDNYASLFELSVENITADMREDLAEFGVHYDNWFSERQFVTSDVVDKLLETLKASGHVYEQDGALWFRSTDFGDEKDRVLVRSNGQRTYFANDVAYHLTKFERGFDMAIDIFGADHHGYVPRMKAAMQASGIDPERLIHLLVQFVSLYRGGEQVQMSTRGGSFVTLRELRHEVGNDAARYFYVMRKSEQAMDFDLDLAKAQSNENPVYYIQYAYARICSVFKQLAERGFTYQETQGLAHLSSLTEEHERQLLNTISRYPDMIRNAALHYEPHTLTHYLREIAADFHAYYNSHQFLVEDVKIRDARLALVTATKIVLLNGFNILGITARESM